MRHVLSALTLGVGMRGTARTMRITYNEVADDYTIVVGHSARPTLEWVEDGRVENIQVESLNPAMIDLYYDAIDS